MFCLGSECREVKYLRQLLKQYVEKSAGDTKEDAAPSSSSHQSAAAAGAASAKGNTDGQNGYHTNMLTSVGDDAGEAISESEMHTALVTATTLARESRIATLERENEALRAQLEASRAGGIGREPTGTVKMVSLVLVRRSCYIHEDMRYFCTETWTWICKDMHD